MGLTERLLAGDRRALARLASLVENEHPVGQEALGRLYPRTGRAHVVGVTGPPGAGKSTLVNRLIRAYRARDRLVGVVAIDPSSALTGGATLGDRVRMMENHADNSVFVRSMAARDQRGGLAAATAGVVHLLDAAGFDPILVETVGVGQAEVDVARLVHTTLVVQVPGTGDDVQAIKAGLLEIGDLLVVNKADLPGADQVVSDLQAMLAIGAPNAGPAVPVLRTTAATGEGTEELVEAIEAHRARLERSGGRTQRDLERAAAEIVALLRRDVERRLAERGPDAKRLRALVAEVAARRRTPTDAARMLLGEPGGSFHG